MRQLLISGESEPVRCLDAERAEALRLFEPAPVQLAGQTSIELEEPCETPTIIR